MSVKTVGKTVVKKVPSVEKTVGEAVGKTVVKKVPSVEKTVGEAVGKTVVKILRLIQNDPHITRESLSKKTGLSVRGVEWNLAKMKKAGHIKRIGSTKRGHWEVVE